MKVRDDPPVAPAIGLQVDLQDLEERVGLSLHVRTSLRQLLNLPIENRCKEAEPIGVEASFYRHHIEG
jgi:hypothetical protein